MFLWLKAFEQLLKANAVASARPAATAALKPRLRGGAARPPRCFPTLRVLLMGLFLHLFQAPQCRFTLRMSRLNRRGARVGVTSDPRAWIKAQRKALFNGTEAYLFKENGARIRGGFVVDHLGLCSASQTPAGGRLFS